jgi:3-hydroxyisobutyrate dehydrogenase-like beta-hydroxyacid dehydrogenase
MEVGWIGVGNMGVPLVERLIAGGHTLTLFDVRQDATEAIATRNFSSGRDAQDVGDLCEVVFVSLPSLSAIRESVLGARGLIYGNKLKLIVNTCTMSTALIAEIEQAAARRGITLIDAPVSGGPEAARKGQLSVMISGDTAGIDSIRPMLELFGTTTVVGQRPGAAQVLKLVNNLIILNAYVGTLEAFVLGAKAGLAPDIMLRAINAGSLAPNGTTKSWLPNYILKGAPVGAKLRMMIKDVDAALAEADRLEVPMWISHATSMVARLAVFRGLGDNDVTDLVRMIEQDSSFQLPRNPDAS